jgi:hypothetical protein
MAGLTRLPSLDEFCVVLVMLQVVKSGRMQKMDKNSASTEQSSQYHFDLPS